MPVGFMQVNDVYKAIETAIRSTEESGAKGSRDIGEIVIDALETCAIYHMTVRDFETVSYLSTRNVPLVGLLQLARVEADRQVFQMERDVKALKRAGLPILSTEEILESKQATLSAILRALDNLFHY